MTEIEIKMKLKEFEQIIFNMHSSQAQKVKEELDSFIKTNNVTPKQMRDFAVSGAGEVLYMLTSDE